MDVIAITKHKGEPRYILVATNRDTFDYYQNRGWEVASDWTGERGSLLVPRDQEEKHDERRRRLGKATLAEWREGRGVGGLLAEVMSEIDA